MSSNLSVRDDLRNVAIVAHVDHGKTTLVDAMLQQAGALGERHEGQAESATRVMDSMDLEREKGITILAKNTAVEIIRDGKPTVINIVDTPGHADFGGEVERGLSMVDGVLLLVDASEGPLPQTRFVLRKAIQAGLPVVLVINKVDRSDARIEEVVDEAYGLFMDLYDDLGMADHGDLDFPIIYAQAKAGKASLNRPENGTSPDNDDLGPLIDVLLETIPAPKYDEAVPLQAHVTNLDASPYLGRLALCRIHNGTMKSGQQVMWCKPDGTQQRAKVAELMLTHGLERRSADEAGPGDLIAVAGIQEIMIGDTLADVDDPRPLEGITVDEPSISMTIGVNTSPLAGKSGSKLTARLVKNRLDTELIGNVSIRVLPTERPDAWEVQGRGELALAVLVETLRREGFELTVGRPEVVTREVDGKIHEPFEHVTIDTPEEFIGALTQLLSVRKGRMETLSSHGTGWARMEWIVPSRGLIGIRTDFLTETRGTAVMNAISHGYGEWVGEIRGRQNGSMVADRTGVSTAYAMFALQERGTMLVEPGASVYEGMVIGENSRQDEMDVNICREKKLTNVRQSTAEELKTLVPPRVLSLEQALEFCSFDECVEVTPDAVRVRKVTLNSSERKRETARRATGR